MVLRGVSLLLLAMASLYLLTDSPGNFARKIVGASPDEAGTRQPVSALAISLDFSGRRQGRRTAVLIEDWLYCYPKTGDVFLVPRGYETDFASIPGVVRWAVNPFGNHAEAAVIHDWLYAVGEVGKRDEADEIFRFAMKEQDVNYVRRNSMYNAVRIGGDEAYGRDEEWRFKDPSTFEKVGEPFSKPSTAAVSRIDCEQLNLHKDDILENFGTFDDF